MPEEGVQLRPREHFMRNEEIFELAKVFVELGVKKIRLTGGEPLIRKGVEHIIEGLSKLPIELTITTNAVRVHKFIDVFKQAGISSVNVSLDTLKADRFKTITRRDQFTQVMSNIHLLLSEGFEVKVNVVLMKGENEDEIIDFVKWTENTKIHIRFIEFMPFDGNQWNWDKKVSFQHIVESVKEYYGKERVIQLPTDKNATSRNFQINTGKGSFGVISTLTNPFCDSCNRIRLTADGKIKNCLFSNQETDLLSALRSGTQVKPLIRQAIEKKKYARAGIEDFADYRGHENRPMVTIGG
jgi:cyclic pyranopterin phosphate synthase